MCFFCQGRYDVVSFFGDSTSYNSRILFIAAYKLRQFCFDDAMTEASDAAAFDHAANVVAKINGNDAAGLQQAGELFAKLSLLGSLATYKVGVVGRTVWWIVVEVSSKQEGL